MFRLGRRSPGSPRMMTYPWLNVSFLILLVVGGLFTPLAARARSLEQEAPPVALYFFWGEGCPACAQAKPFLEELTSRYPQLEVLDFEVYSSADNQVIFKEMAASQGFEPRYVPTIFIGDQHWQGFSAPLRGEIEQAVQACIEGWCPDAGGGIVPGREVLERPDDVPIDVPMEEPETPVEGLQINIFWGDAGCSDCVAVVTHHATLTGFSQFGRDGGEEARAFLALLEEEYPDIQVNSYEVWIATRNGPRFRAMAEAYDFTARGLPTIFIGERYWEGFDEETGAEIEAYVQECLEEGCTTPLAEESIADPTPNPTPTPTPPVEPTPTPTVEPTPVAPVVSDDVPPTSASTLTLPLLGTVNLGRQSLWASTAIIAFVDGFNPCSLWVLSILISLTLRTGSRKKVFITGFTFLFITSLIYVLFIAGLFTMFTFIGFMGWIQVLVAVLALLFAAVNIKDYFWYKQGLSFTIADEKKPGIYKQMRKVMAADSLWAMLTTTVVMSAGIAIVELPCTAGFPVLWTNLLTAQGVTQSTFFLLLALYMLIYLIDELVVFVIAVFTLRSNRMEEKHGRVLKLIGGMLMLMLAGVMLINPTMMNELGTSLLIFAGAMVAALLVLVIHRRLLPKLGIHIGTELKTANE